MQFLDPAILPAITATVGTVLGVAITKLFDWLQQKQRDGAALLRLEYEHWQMLHEKLRQEKMKQLAAMTKCIAATLT